MGVFPPSRGRFNATALEARLKLVLAWAEYTGRTPPPKLMADENCRTVAAVVGRGGNWVPSAGARPSEPVVVFTVFERGTPRFDERLIVARSGRNSMGSLGTWATRVAVSHGTSQSNRKRRNEFMASAAEPKVGSNRHH